MSDASLSLPAPSTRFIDQLPDYLRHSPCACAPAYQRADRRSIYVPVEDGTELAVDIFLPGGWSREQKLPTLFVATRYWRARQGENLQPDLRFWSARGFAVVVADVRGTGASFGQWYLPYTAREVRDVGHLANWIAAQSWSNGKVATTGRSYTGTTALTAGAYGQPAVKVIVSCFSDFDQYTDLNFPGGVVAEDLLRRWGQMVRRLDCNERAAGLPGVRPVDGPGGAQKLQLAIADHQRNPVSLDQAAYQVVCKDDLLDQFGGLAIDEAGTFNHQAMIEASGTPIMGWGSWMDAGIAQGMISRFLNWKVPQLSIIGPWTHGAAHDADPFKPLGNPVDPPQDLQQRLYAAFAEPFVHIGATPPVVDSRIIYYTMGEDMWKTTKVWPVTGNTAARLYFDAGGLLSVDRSEAAGTDCYHVDFNVSTGPTNRWAVQAVAGALIDYGDRAPVDVQLLTYTTPPLADEIEVTGEPLVCLQLRSNQPDGHVFAYLEDVAPDGRVTYVTEGQLRLLHRACSDVAGSYATTYPHRSFRREHAAPLVPGEWVELTFQLLATSVLFKAGHRIRLAIAGADAAIFSRVPPAEFGEVTLDIATGGSGGSFLQLPVVPRPRRADD